MHTGEVLTYPKGIEDYYSEDDEEFQYFAEIINKVESARRDYIKFESLRSLDAFRIMKRFTLTIDDDRFRRQVLERLFGPKPFRRFKDLVHFSDDADKWYAFEQKAYEDYVRKRWKEKSECLKENNCVEEDEFNPFF